MIRRRLSAVQSRLDTGCTPVCPDILSVCRRFQLVVTLALNGHRKAQTCFLAAIHRITVGFVSLWLRGYDTPEKLFEYALRRCNRRPAEALFVVPAAIYRERSSGTSGNGGSARSSMRWSDCRSSRTDRDGRPGEANKSSSGLRPRASQACLNA